MTAAHVAVVGGVDDERVVAQSALIKAGEDEADGVVETGDGGEITCDGGRPVSPCHVVNAPCVAHLALDEGLVETGIIKAGPGRDGSGIVECGQFSRRHAREVRLGHVPVNEKRVAVFGGEIEPAEDLMRAPGGRGLTGGDVRIIGAKPVVFWDGRDTLRGAPFFVAPFRDKIMKAEVVGLMVRINMPAANVHGAIASGFYSAGTSGGRGIKRFESFAIIIEDDAVLGRPLAGEERAARGHADGNGGERVGERNALARELVEMGCTYQRMAGIAHAVVAVLIGVDKENVRFRHGKNCSGNGRGCQGKEVSDTAANEIAVKHTMRMLISRHASRRSWECTAYK